MYPKLPNSYTPLVTSIKADLYLFIGTVQYSGTYTYVPDGDIICQGQNLEPCKYCNLQSTRFTLMKPGQMGH